MQGNCFVKIAVAKGGEVKVKADIPSLHKNGEMARFR
jgi:hypothetical protein